MMRVLDLFSGIGGFSIGLENAGMRTVAFCEIDPFCRQVLAKHWPDVPIYEDVRELTADTLQRDGIAADLICGGFPCQDLSTAGKRAGLEGARSGLWREYARIIRELRPGFVIVENVPGLLSLGMGDVLGDLAALGYNTTWDCIPASAIGAPHRRDRLWIVAHANSDRRDADGEGQARHEGNALAATVALREPRVRTTGAADVADAARERRGQGRPRRALAHGEGRGDAAGEALADAGRLLSQVSTPGQLATVAFSERNAWWSVEPNVGRVAHGVPSRVDRLRSLGNAVVPQIPELIGRAILQTQGLKSEMRAEGSIVEKNDG